MKKQIEARSHMNPNAWMCPERFTQTMTLKQLQETMLHYDGQILACGEFWHIRYKKLCPGVYNVYLEKKVFT